MYAKFWKRIFDFIISLIALVILSPLLVLLTVIGAIAMGGNPFFVQKRPGMIDKKIGKERIISLLKFRTMSNKTGSDGELLPDAQRLNKYGRFLRATSLDELPSLVNMLIGEISLVGPRPWLCKYLDYYSDWERQRHTVRPGLTGLAQVSGRNALTWKTRFEKDIEYVENISLRLDIKILLLTVKKVFIHEGIEFTNNQTIMEYFSDKDRGGRIIEETKKKALVLCGGLPQIALIEDLKSRGIETILLDMNDKVKAREYADKFYPVSVLDVDAVREIAVKEKVDYILTACADQVLLVVAQLCEELGLPWYIDYNTAKNVSDKSHMKRIFSENDVPTSKHIVSDQYNESIDDGMKYPLIVKPVDSYSSRGVKKVESKEELKKAFREAIEISRTKTAIVEEFVQGKELSVDVYVENGISHILCISQLDKIPGNSKFVINRCCYPARISEEEVKMVGEACQKIATAFGLLNSPMLVQLITTGERISVLEFCARTGGGDKFRLIKKATGFDVIKAVTDLTLGLYPHVGERSAESTYILDEFLYCDAGTFDRIEGLDEALESGLISEYFVLKTKGTPLNEATCSGDRVAYFTIQTDDYETLKRNQNLVNKAIKAVDEKGDDILRHELLDTME